MLNNWDQVVFTIFRLFLEPDRNRVCSKSFGIWKIKSDLGWFNCNMNLQWICVCVFRLVGRETQWSLSTWSSIFICFCKQQLWLAKINHVIYFGRWHLLFAKTKEDRNYKSKGSISTSLNWRAILNPQAMLVEAETLYLTGEFERSLVLHERGCQTRPDMTEFNGGRNKCRAAILNAIGGLNCLFLY